MNKCIDCKFFEPMPGDEAGHCRRFPPVAKMLTNEDVGDAVFPIVRAASDWCGEYEDRPAIDRINRHLKQSRTAVQPIPVYPGTRRT